MQAVLTRSPLRIHTLLCALLLCLVTGFWTLGKPFSYVGIYPVYIGEVFLFLGLALIAYRGQYYLLRKPSFWILWLFLLVAVVQGVISCVVQKQPPMEVLRNLAVAYYALYAYIAYVVAVHAERAGPFYEHVIRRVLPNLVPWVVAGGILSFLGSTYLSQTTPVYIPGTEVSLIGFKPAVVILAMTVVCGLYFRGYLPIPHLVFGLIPILGAVARSRAAMLTFLVAMAFFLRPSKRYLRLLGIGVLAVVIIAISGVRFSVGGYREVSATQLATNMLSLAGADEGDTVAKGTKEWRYNWWQKIVTDAVEHQRIVVGLGWGSNLANEFGYQTTNDEEGLNVLRNPHNVVMSILGRGGWLATWLWILFYICLLIELGKAARHLNHWERDLLALTVIYILGSLINGLMDVFLESPFGAIPQWIAVGIAWGLIHKAQALRTDS